MPRYLERQKEEGNEQIESEDKGEGKVKGFLTEKTLRWMVREVEGKVGTMRTIQGGKTSLEFEVADSSRRNLKGVVNTPA